MARLPPTWETPSQTIEILQAVLATEIVCVLRYTMNAVAAAGLASESVKEEFDQHADEERGHMRQVAERINQLGREAQLQPRRSAFAARLRNMRTRTLWSA